MQVEDTSSPDGEQPGINTLESAAQAATPAVVDEAHHQDVHYYSISELPQQGVALHRFSLRRKSTLVAISLFAALCLMITGITTASIALTSATRALENDSAGGTYRRNRPSNYRWPELSSLGPAASLPSSSPC